MRSCIMYVRDALVSCAVIARRGFCSGAGKLGRSKLGLGKLSFGKVGR